MPSHEGSVAYFGELTATSLIQIQLLDRRRTIRFLFFALGLIIVIDLLDWIRYSSMRCSAIKNKHPTPFSQQTSSESDHATRVGS
jgi:hypothetical protein